MIRGIVKSVTEGIVKLFSCSGRAGETFDGREYMQHYGFTSRPLAGAELIIINEENHYIAIASEDRRYRLAVEAGEVTLYTDEGDKIHLKRDRTIHIKSGNKLVADVDKEVIVNTQTAEITAGTQARVTAPEIVANASTSAIVTAPVVTATAGTSCTVSSPEINLGGERSGLWALVDERIVAFFNQHTHAVSGGSTNAGKPSAEMTTFDASILDIFNNHTHSVTTGSGTSAAPGTPLAVADVATTAVKGK